MRTEPRRILQARSLLGLYIDCHTAFFVYQEAIAFEGFFLMKQ